MSRYNQKPKARPVASQQEDTPLDFNPGERLKNALASRPVEEGITIDPRGTRIIDDGLWIRSLNTGWVLKTHIADAPSVIPDKSVLEDVARLRKADQDSRGHVIRMFPGDFLDRYVSLHEGKQRPAITFRIELDRSGAVKDYRVYRSIFQSRQQCDYSPLRRQFNMHKEDYQGWKELAKRLLFSRQRKLAIESDMLVNNGKREERRESGVMMLEKDIMSTLVHEAMLLTNTLALDFFRKNNVMAPTKVRGMSVNTISMSPDFEFERACNKLCWDVLNHLSSNQDPHVRITSPMRNFRDYVALKLMGRVLARQDTRDLQQDTASFSERFNAKASELENFMLSERWGSTWGRRTVHGHENHPFHRGLSYGGPQSNVGKLAALCKQEGWNWPHVSERELQLQGTNLYFAGMNFHSPKGRSQQTWAVSYDPETALSMAARRMMDVISPTVSKTPPQSDPDKPGFN